ncbi:hypothetical protein LCGC14_1403080 [marine sediment metagenome]|uniref:Uncharacterized protein n=1 Tax=marine sediment metagenome TaxID=412755 RepID=A0A0F9JWS0_9ZZZZ
MDKRCPFCEYKFTPSVENVPHIDIKNDGTRILKKPIHKVATCTKCEAQGPPSETKKGAIKAWNRREVGK